MHTIIARAVFITSLAHLSACAFDGGGLDDESLDGQFRDVVRIDGNLYPRPGYRELFGDQDLHWVLTQEVLDTGIQIAFTSEGARNEFLGFQPDAIESKDVTIDATYARLWKDAGLSSESRNVTGGISNLGDSWNDRTSSVQVFGNPIVLYEHINKGGCSFSMTSATTYSDLTDYDFCGFFTGSWNDKASSVGIVF